MFSSKIKKALCAFFACTAIAFSLIPSVGATSLCPIPELITVYDSFGMPHIIQDGEALGEIIDSNGNVIGVTNVTQSVFVNGSFQLPVGQGFRTMRYELLPNNNKQILEFGFYYSAGSTGTTANRVFDKYVYGSTTLSPSSADTVIRQQLGINTTSGGNVYDGWIIHPSTSRSYYFAEYFNKGTTVMNLHITVARKTCSQNCNC